MKTALTVTADGKFVEAVVGYRMWRMFGDHGSMFLNSVWSPAMWDDDTAEITAECQCWSRIETDSVIDRVSSLKVSPKEHVCGIYAWARLPRILSYNFLKQTTIVAGEVRLWGDVHVHERGYRAEHARIAALFAAPHDPVRGKRIELAALTYNVPLVTLSAEEVK